MMTLTILLPSHLFLAKKEVQHIALETVSGSYGFLPNRLDAVAALSPGVLSYRDHKENEFFLALDEGLVVKRGRDVLVSTRQAIGGEDLTELRSMVRGQFLDRGEKEQDIRLVLQKMESQLILDLSDVLS